MKISIVTISYNQAGFLERAIRSVINQDYPDIEYIVVDPGSTDGSRKIIERYRDRIDKVIFEPDSGPADGLNKGFSKATGDILGYLNSDDAYLPGTFGKVSEAFRLSPECKVIYGHGYIVDSAGRVNRRFYSDRFTPWRFVHGSAVVMQQSTFFRRDAFLTAGGFNKKNPIWWDAELLLDFSMNNMKMRVVNDFWALFTIHDESITGQKGMHTCKSRQVDANRKKTRERLYAKVTGHQFNRWSLFLTLVARVHKWTIHPVRLFWRITEKMGLRARHGSIRL